MKTAIARREDLRASALAKLDADALERAPEGVRMFT
jgi:hypothetical protein